MSPSNSQAELAPTWKQEVNRRLAAHQSRRGSSPAQPEVHRLVPHGASSVAAQAAARVAARYAKAPTYSEMLAEEARAAVRAAEAASRAAQEAQARAESVLAGLEAGLESRLEARREVAPAAAPLWEPMDPVHVMTPQLALAEPLAETARPAQQRLAPVSALISTPVSEPFFEQGLEPAPAMGEETPGAFWEASRPLQAVEPAPAEAAWARSEFAKPEFARPEPARTEPDRAELALDSQRPDGRAVPQPGWWEQPVLEREPFEEAEVEHAGAVPDAPAPTFYANLIEFPRELVATRKVRPRLAEGPLAAVAEPSGQLSIFEVDPGTISTQPEAVDVAHEAAAPAWQAREWPRIELDERPMGQPVEEAAGEVEREAKTAALNMAPFGLRLMATVVDGSLMAGALVGAAAVAAMHLKVLPPVKEIEIGSALALAVIGLLYHALFFMLAEATPGMKYAGISLCTFDDQKPTRAQLRSRLGAMILSLLPVGLGLAWSIFDDEHLTWHDRLSGTYPRRG